MSIGRHPIESSNEEGQDTPINHDAARVAAKPESLEERERKTPKTHPSSRSNPPEPSVGRGSIVASIASTLLLRITSRTSFVVLSFYLGERFSSALIVLLV